MLWAFGKGIASGFLVVVLISLGLLSVYIFLYKSVDPDPSVITRPILPESSKIYSRDGQLMYEIYKEYKRTPVALNEIAVPLQQAIITAEDKDFYKHFGVSVSGILRSAFLDSAQQEFAYGGSTITQQLIKAYVLTNEKTVSRKIAEAVWAIEVERRLSKEKILELYLNSAPFGRNAYGAEAAARAYFGKSAKDLSLPESAYLAAMPNAPSLLSPDGEKRAELDVRKNKILKLMLQQGYITNDVYVSAIGEKPNFLPATERILAPHFVFWIKRQLEEKYGQDRVNEGGLQVQTTLDLKLQDLAEKVVAEGAVKNAKSFKARNAALAAIDVKTGQVLALVGSKDYFGQAEPVGCVSGKDCLFEPNANAATSLRQPGSSFKPYVYATAFSREQALNPGSVVLDAVKNFSRPGAVPYAPKNYNGAQYGRVSLRKALAGSLNVATVRLAAQLGVESIVNTARKFGIKEDFSRCGLSLALGSCEISLVEHTAGIAGIANGGLMHNAAGILKIRDKTGNTLEEFFPHSEQAIDPQSAYELISVMKDSKAREFIFGKHPALTLPGREVIAKTGTTQNWKDGWTLGATRTLSAGVWVGNNDGTVMAKGADGVFVAAPIWQKFMSSASALYTAETFPIPSGITEIKINPLTGQLAKAGQRSVTEISADFAVPKPPPPPPPKPAPEVKPQKPAAPINYEPKAARILSPQDGQWVLREDLRVTGEAEIKNGTRASLFLDGELVQNISGPFFNWTVPAAMLTAGHHTLRLFAVNQTGYRSEQVISIEVKE